MKINDVAELVGVSASTLRYWERKLGLDVPRDAYGSRTFDAEWIAYFKQVKSLLDEDLGWDEIWKQLEQPDTGASQRVSYSTRDLSPITGTNSKFKTPRRGRLCVFAPQPTRST